MQKTTHPIKRFTHAKILLDHQIQDGELWVAEGKVIPPQEKADISIDVKGQLLAPGFIDLQINGGFGIDFSKDPQKVNFVAKQLLQHGVTSFLPTVISSTAKQYRSILPQLQPRSFGSHGATLLGIHLEGPFFSPLYSGAHNKEFIRSTFEDVNTLEDIYGSLQGVKLVTLAPELPGASDFIQQLRNKNIIVAAGHSNASFNDMKIGIESGIQLATHLFNAMRPYNHRDPGLIGAALIQPTLFYSIIADGVHISAETISLCWHCNPKGLILITDATAALGLSDGKYQLGTMEIDVKDKKVHLSGTETLAGSALSLDEAVRYLRKTTNCSVVEALESASLKPAQLIDVYPSKGSLHVGADADFLILTEDLFVQSSYIGGELAWTLKN